MSRHDPYRCGVDDCGCYDKVESAEFVRTNEILADQKRFEECAADSDLAEQVKHDECIHRLGQICDDLRSHPAGHDFIRIPRVLAADFAQARRCIADRQAKKEIKDEFDNPEVELSCDEEEIVLRRYA